MALFFLVRAVLFSGLESDVRERAENVARSVEAGKNLGRVETRRLALDGIFVVVRDEDGRVLSQTLAISDEDPEDAGPPAWRRALESGKPASGLSEAAGEDGSYVYAVPVRPPSGSRASVVEAGKSYQPVHETVETFGFLLVGVIGGAFLLSVIGAYVLAGTALSPVEAIVRSAREITEGDLDQRLPVDNQKDEIGRLAVTMNGLLSRLQAAFARREEALAHQRRFAADASHEAGLRAFPQDRRGTFQRAGRWTRAGHSPPDRRGTRRPYRDQ